MPISFDFLASTLRKPSKIRTSMNERLLTNAMIPFASSLSLAQRKKRAYMSYTNEPRMIRDFLPSPQELAFRDEDVQITITLGKKSVDFFKTEAAKGDRPYQRMIRRLLDAYVDAHATEAPRAGRVSPKRARAG